MKQFIETASDKNVRGVEFFVKDIADGYVYEDAEFKNKVTTEVLKHAFEMNNIVVIDNNIACRALTLEEKGGYVVATYLFPSVADNVVSVTPKQIRSLDKVLVTDVNIGAETDLFGKVVGDLQENIEFDGNKIKGRLKHVTGYTGFSGDERLQSGNYLALHSTTNDGESISVGLIGGESGPTQLDEDGIIVLRIANKEQKVKVTSGNMTKEYSLDSLALSNN